ncbi:MAG: mechanosensitive ion channel domain-containing protein [Chitinophagaceae bacterium]
MFSKAVPYGKTLHLILFLGFLVLVQPALSQSPQVIPAPIHDTLIPSLITKVAAYSFTIDRSYSLLQRNYDLSKMEANLPDIEKRLTGFKSRLETKGGQMNLLSLNSSVIMLAEVMEQLRANQKVLQAYCSRLTGSITSVNKIINDADLTLSVPDTSLLDQLLDLQEEVFVLDALQRHKMNNLNLMLNRVSVNLLQANDVMSDLRYLTISIKSAMLVPEQKPLLTARPADYIQAYSAVTVKALLLSGKIISIYTRRKWDVLAISLFVFMLTTAWCLSNVRRIKRRQDSAIILQKVHFLRRSVFVGNLVALFTYSPLFFADPTISYLNANGLLLLSSLSFLIFPYLVKQAKIMWVAVCLLWLFYALDDLLLESAFGERWGLFIGGLIMIGMCSYVIRSKRRIFYKIAESPATKALLFFTAVLSVMSVLFNLAGNVTLAKLSGITAIEGLVLGMSLKVFCTMVLESVYLQSEAYHQSRFSEYINYKEQQHRFLKILWILATVVWIGAFLRHITLYDAVITWCIFFLQKHRAIGNMTFTFGSAAVFIGIIWVSSVISGVINFFFSYSNANTPGKRSTLGSMRLLMRLAIWAIGFLIAVAAAGIPLDKLSLMIGALGVGIGFGLQNIVNNLVSGVILAFERPVQIGDLIEIGNKKGIVEEIGVRSSKIKSSDGADIIIPNGDLLGQHLINWTMKDRYKRVEFIIGIRYQTDIRRAKELIQETLRENENILIPPEPVVIVQEFTDNAINIRILFWSSEVSQSGTVRSNAMIGIYEAFTRVGIQLPYTREMNMN